MSQEFDTIIANSPVLCNEAESHETLGRKHVAKIDNFSFRTPLQHRHGGAVLRHLACGMFKETCNFQLLLAYGIYFKKKKTVPNTTQNTAQHSTTAIG